MKATKTRPEILRVMADGGVYTTPQIADRTEFMKTSIYSMLVAMRKEGLVGRRGTGRAGVHGKALEWKLTKAGLAEAAKL